MLFPNQHAAPYSTPPVCWCVPHLVDAVPTVQELAAVLHRKELPHRESESAEVL